MIRFQDNTVRDGMQQRNINKNYRTKSLRKESKVVQTKKQY